MNIRFEYNTLYLRRVYFIHQLTDKIMLGLHHEDIDKYQYFIHLMTMKEIIPLGTIFPVISSNDMELVMSTLSTILSPIAEQWHTVTKHPSEDNLTKLRRGIYIFNKCYEDYLINGMKLRLKDDLAYDYPSSNDILNVYRLIEYALKGNHCMCNHNTDFIPLKDFKKGMYANHAHHCVYTVKKSDVQTTISTTLL